jgi:uncharacterized protein YcnI
MSMAMALAFLTAAQGHISFSPASGHEANAYISLVMNVPHGVDGLTSSRFEITVPSGVQSAVPEDLPGWVSTVETRELGAAEQYLSHGALVTTAPSKLVY